MDIKDLAPEVQALVSNMNPEIRAQLARSVELGRWPDGTSLSDEQKGHAMQAVMLWDSVYGQEDESEPFKVLKGGKLIRQVERDRKMNKQTTANSTNQDKEGQSIDINWQ